MASVGVFEDIFGDVGGVVGDVEAIGSICRSNPFRAVPRIK
jgi:hypothetical protein